MVLHSHLQPVVVIADSMGRLISASLVSACAVVIDGLCLSRGLIQTMPAAQFIASIESQNGYWRSSRLLA